MGTQLDVRVVGGDNHVRVLVQGDVDLATVDDLRDALLLAQHTDNVVIDLSRVTFMDSSGINVIVHAHRRVAEGRYLRVVGAQRALRQVFETTGLLGLLSDGSDEGSDDRAPAAEESARKGTR